MRRAYMHAYVYVLYLCVCGGCMCLPIYALLMFLRMLVWVPDYPLFNYVQACYIRVMFGSHVCIKQQEPNIAFRSHRISTFSATQTDHRILSPQNVHV